MNNNIDMNFPITVFGNLEKFSDVMSLGRCRIFYKYGNRNGTYITDEFAEQLIASLPYTPVKGIFDEIDGDYTDHGEKRDMGRIYGIVPGPQDMNFAWEKHVDDDGVEREYACVNVYYYTALYEEAGDIFGKSQSMELYRKSIVGDWKIINGKQYYVFEKGCFLGLQVLGDNVEPCFEGAAFFSLYQSVKDLYEKLEQYQSNFQNYGEGGNTMPTINFKVSDNQKHDFLWSLLNVNFTEEGGWAVEYGICEIYDEYAIVRNYAVGIYERVYYTKNDETDSLEITKKEQCYIVDVNESEKKALTILQSMNGNNYELVDERLTNAENSVATLTEQNTALTEQNSTFSTTIEELNNNIATLNTEKADVDALYTAATDKIASMETEYSAAQATIASLTEERDALATFKKDTIDEQKKAIIANYASVLDKEILDTYTEGMDNYTLEQLDMQLTYEQKKAHPEVFTKNAPAAYVPKEGTPKSGIEALLSKYERR